MDTFILSIVGGAAGRENSIQTATKQSSVGCWGALKYLYNIFWLCIAGAFAKFVIFENRIFCKTRRSQVNFLLTDFVFFTVFRYIYIYIYTIE